MTGVWDVMQVKYQSDWSLGCYAGQVSELLESGMLCRSSIRVTGVWDVMQVKCQSDWSLGCYAGQVSE